MKSRYDKNWRLLRGISITMSLMLCATSRLDAVTNENNCAKLATETDSSSKTVNVYCRAVQNGCLIKLTYKDDLPDQPRKMRPYAVGVSFKSNVLLFGEQLEGYSKSASEGHGEIPGWRNFNLAKIVSASILPNAARFHSPEPDASRAIKTYTCKDPLMVTE